jgi:hypothetical protein
MMTIQELDDLLTLEQAASPAPWHVSHGNDDLGMSSVAVTKNPSVGREVELLTEWVAEDVVAGCLIQSTSLVAADDKCWTENARLIAATRNALPELLRLAKLGLAATMQR